MKSLILSHYALAMGAATALLAGCGEAQPPIGVPGAMPQRRAIATHAARSGSWMLPQAKGKDLLYVADAQNYNVRVYSYPEGALVGTLSVYDAWAACADNEGDVFISSTAGYRPEILEYKHGGTNPIAVLQDGDSAYFPSDCSVDPTTGNLAVANDDGYYGGSSGNVAIYAGAQGSPKFLSDDKIPYIWSCAYDDKGNLYVDGSGYYPRLKFAEIKRGESGFQSIKLHGELCCDGVPITWKDNRLDVADDFTLYEFKIKGRSGHETRSIIISGKGVERITIRRGTLLGSGYAADAVYLWHYPSGGYPYKTITQGLSMPEGVAISM